MFDFAASLKGKRKTWIQTPHNIELSSVDHGMSVLGHE